MVTHVIHCIQVIRLQASNLDTKQCLLDINEVHSEVGWTSSLNTITRDPPEKCHGPNIQ